MGALALGAFCFGTTENLPVGLLPLMAADLDRSLSAVGLLVTGYGLTVAVVSVPLTRLTARTRRRVLLPVLLSVFVVTTWISVAAVDYWMLLGARVVMALSQAVFWPVAVVAAAGLFSPRVRGRAASVVFAGGSLAVVLGVPAGTWLGQQAGWRISFLVLSGLGVLACLALAALLPAGDPGESHAATADSPDARRYWLLVVTTALTISGFFTVFTYITVYLTEVSGFSAASISPLLLIYGAVDFAGLMAVGAVVDRGPRITMIASIALLAAAFLGLYAFGTHQIATIGSLALMGVGLPGMVAGLQVRVLQVAPGNTDIASAGTSAAFNVGIGGGALVGGLLLPATGVRGTALAAALLVTAALVLSLTDHRRRNL
ncbi:MAG TPA: MFS transporter [Streptosporangiaceae bacterium]|nr:MFS transporter [Streptosporangiaceae bacterium]